MRFIMTSIMTSIILPKACYKEFVISVKNNVSKSIRSITEKSYPNHKSVVSIAFVKVQCSFQHSFAVEQVISI